ncbi:MAG: SusC/RagA family TonB-linked outer membrane protein [Bacteroidaceae bacterium]|nr:SusC/RagA family TonB-linked outer membrane protein [Bacteroidaceae bacterium]
MNTMIKADFPLRIAVRALIVVGLLMLSQTLSADTVLKGIVADASTQEPIAGARVAVHGGQQHSTLTDETGGYTLSVPDGATFLDVSAPGYNLVQKPIAAARKAGQVLLFPETFSDDYAQELAVGSHHSINDFSVSASLSAGEEIAAALGADVHAVTRSGMPAMGAAMFVGGLNSLHANAQPLVIVDGVYYDGQYGRELLHEGYAGNMLANISVADIERITVLKNATALYGTKGANGVIVIDTKRSKSMATRIEVNAMAGVESAPRLTAMMNAADFRLYASELIGGTETKQTSFRFLKDDPQYYYYKKYHNETCWNDFLYREALSQNYSINVQGGDEVADYNLSLGYAAAQSTLRCNDFSRLNLRFNTDIKLTERMKTRFDVAYNNNTRDLRNDGVPEDFESNTILSPGFLGYIKAPFLHPYRYDGQGMLTTFVEDADDFAQGLALNSSWANPVAINEYGEARNKNYLEQSMFTITIAPSYDITAHLTASTLFSYSLANVNERSFVPMTGVPVFYINGVGTSYNTASNLTAKQESLFSDTRLRWDGTSGAHGWQLTGGFRFTDSGYDSSQQEGHNTGNDKTPNLSNSLAFKKVGGEDDRWRSFAWYGIADYSLQQKYFLEGSVTMETTSRFGTNAKEGLGLAGVKWGLFPSLQAAWLMSSEPFMAAVPGIDFLKLRAGYDVTGNDDIGISAAQTSFTSRKYLDNSIGLTLSGIGNNTIQWETTRRVSGGADVLAFGNRLKVNLNVFKSFTSNLLTLKSLPEISGMGSYWSNGGRLENTGFDVAVASKLIASRHWEWEAGFSVGHYRNTITELPDGDFTTALYGAEVLTAVGHPAGVFYGYQTAGVFATTEEAQQAGLYQRLTTGAREYFGAGDMIFVDQDSNSEINDADKTVIGDPNPDAYGNIFSSLRWKRLSLDVQMGYSWGNDVYNYLRSQLEAGSNFFNQTTALNRRWIAEGQQTDIPRAAFGDPMGNARFSDRWIEDGSYLRLRRATLSYKLPVNSIWMQGLTVWLTGNNLFTLTRYLGPDPESSVGNSVLSQGIDAGLVPQGRSLLMGVKLNL